MEESLINIRSNQAGNQENMLIPALITFQMELNNLQVKMTNSGP